MFLLFTSVPGFLPVKMQCRYGFDLILECYCFLINIIVVFVGARRDALVYARCVFYLKISIGPAFRLGLPSVARCCCWLFFVEVSLFGAFRLYIKTLIFHPAVKKQSLGFFLRHESAKKLFSSTRRLFFHDS